MSKNSIATRIVAAIANTNEADPMYIGRTLAQRQPGGEGAGSIFLETVSLEQLINADWEEYSHPEIQTGCTGFIANIPGRLGVVELSMLNPNQKIILDDRKGVGNVSATVKGSMGEIIDYTVLILGMEDGKELLFTFHPGAPVSASRVKTEPGMHGKQIDTAEAISMGLQTAKIVA